MQAQFNPLPLLSVKSGLDSSLVNISRELESFFASDGAKKQALKNALDDLHRIGGVLRMLSLSGLVAFCAELKTLLQEMEQPQEISAARRDVVRRALFGLMHYLDALADGASNATLRLFNEYQEMHQARGLEMAFDVDLFFPELQVTLPKEVLRSPQEADAPARIKAARQKFQQGLLKWLRQDNQADALHAMTAAVHSAGNCVAQNQQRAFWWVAGGLLDCLLHDGVPPEQNVKKTLSRIDIKMKSMTDGSAFDEEAAISEMLYFIAHSHSVSELVEQIKKTYALEIYLPEERPLPSSETSSLLDNMRAYLSVAKESWERCIAEEHNGCQKFAEHMAQIHELSDQLDRNTLQFLSKQILSAALQVNEPERAQHISMDMAMALLLLDSGIEHYQHLGSGFQEQARILSARLQAGMARMPEDSGKLATLIELFCQMEQHEVMVPLAAEMQGNLQHIEQSLNAFFNNSAKRAELTQIGRLQSQVQGGLHILSLDVAVELMRMLRLVTDRYVHGETPSSQEMRIVAAAVSALEEYVHGLVMGQKPNPSTLKGVLQEITELRSSAGHNAAPEPEELPSSGVSVRTGGEDEELLEVFLEEAREVMETLRSNLEVSRNHLDSREPLVTMRRGFHTLKGSGRMVGLSELGEVAWAVERAMNTWLQEDKPATPALLDMIGDAEVLFQHWVDMLKSGSTSAMIDTTDLLHVADCIENGKPLSSVIPEPIKPEPAQELIEVDSLPEEVDSELEEIDPAQEEEHASIEIGKISLSASLFSIATEEAADHVRELHNQLEQTYEHHEHVVSYDFMRAAHTLAGVNRTMGFVQIAELSYALELWLEERIDKYNVIDAGQMALIKRIVQQLDEACRQVRELRQEPRAYPELIAELQANKHFATEAVETGSHELQPLEFDLSDIHAEIVAKPEVTAEPAFEFEPLFEITPEASKVAETAAAVEIEVTDAASEETQLGVVHAEEAEKKSEFVLDFASPKESEPRQEPQAQVPVADFSFDLTAPASDVESGDILLQEEAETGHDPIERVVHDEVDEQLLPIFLEEAHELYPQIGSTLRAWRENPADAQLGRNLQRSLHTLKGSARMAGAMRLGELTHRVEDRVDRAMNEGGFNAGLWSELDNYLDRIGSSIDHLQHPQAAVEAVSLQRDQDARQRQFETTQSIPVQALEVGAERAMQAALLRVRSDTVDHLVNEAGEISVARSRAVLELRNFKGSLLELTDSVNRLRKQLREIEIHAEGQMQARTSTSGDSAEKFDPLEFDRFTRFQEVTRFMNESVHDVQTVQQTLLKNLAETEIALNAQAHLNRDLQQGLMSIRMVPFASVSERLYRIVRQTGKELGKRANLELSGTEVEMDRSVLEKMTAPFEHLLRNAIAHGLETPEQRVQANKEPIGEIRLSLRQDSNEVVFEFADDGAGLDIARVRQKAMDNGVLQQGEEISDELAMQLIFTPGLSTAKEVTEISGRGVGLDVVRSEITALGGRVDVNSEPGRGVNFTIHLPLTLAVTKTLMVRAGQHVYAMPANMIENVQQLKPAALEAIYQQHYNDWNGARYPLHHLARLLGEDDAEVVSQPHNPVLLMRSGDNRIAVHVDELLGNQEVVVKNIGPQLARLPGIAGATVSGSGKVILIINPIAFSQRIVVTRKIAKAAVAAEAVHKLPVVMVVDDSLTVRKITSRLLSRSGYQVLTAKDGVDALEQLKESLPDVMLLDVEMPRMDGFELTKRLRQDSRTKDLPIIMITSRTADKHRHFALELGVNEYLGKPYQEDELLQNIARFITKR